MRPTLHFTAASGWINDPHGITATDRGYEVFFQYIPGRTTWAPNCHWGHASGADLLTLREKPVAIAPGDGDDGIWTGCVIEDGDDVRAFYTAVSTPDFGIGRVRMARPADPEWNTWVKEDVVVEAPPGQDLIAFRDPSIRRDGDQWRMCIGAAGRDGTAMALTYTSIDLCAWSYDGVALQRSSTERDPVWTGALWECPQVFELGGQTVMVSSIWDADVLHYAAYAIGSLAEGRLNASAWGRLTWGPSLYAPSLFTDVEGRLALTFWLRGITGDGWAGAHSFPYRLEFADGHRVVVAPHPDVAAHRTARILGGEIPGLAADIEWQSTRGILTITSGDALVASLEVTDGAATVVSASGATTFPIEGTVRIILDGPVLEISSPAGLFASPIEPRGSHLTVTASAGTIDVFGLV